MTQISDTEPGPDAAPAAQKTATRLWTRNQSALQSKEQGVRKTQEALDALEGKLQASSISQDGVYVVGHNIKNGTWHAPGDGGQNDDACYYATLNSTNTSDISDHNNFGGAETVSLGSVDAFQISGPCTWHCVEAEASHRGRWPLPAGCRPMRSRSERTVTTTASRGWNPPAWWGASCSLRLAKRNKAASSS